MEEGKKEVSGREAKRRIRAKAEVRTIKVEILFVPDSCSQSSFLDLEPCSLTTPVCCETLVLLFVRMWLAL